MWFNRIVLSLLDSPMHGAMSGSTMTLHFRGRKSGKQYATPVDYAREILPDGNERLWTMSDRGRSWWRNFNGGAPADLLIKRRRVAATGELIDEPAKVAEALVRYLRLAPRVARFIKVPIADGAADGAANAARIAQASQKYVFVCFTPLAPQPGSAPAAINAQ